MVSDPEGLIPASQIFHPSSRKPSAARLSGTSINESNSPGPGSERCSRKRSHRPVRDDGWKDMLDGMTPTQPEVTFRPTMPATTVAMKNKRSADAGSENSTIPAMTVPAAPMPVQTA